MDTNTICQMSKPQRDKIYFSYTHKTLQIHCINSSIGYSTYIKRVAGIFLGECF